MRPLCLFGELPTHRFIGTHSPGTCQDFRWHRCLAHGIFSADSRACFFLLSSPLSFFFSPSSLLSPLPRACLLLTPSLFSSSLLSSPTTSISTYTSDLVSFWQRFYHLFRAAHLRASAGRLLLYSWLGQLLDVTIRIAIALHAYRLPTLSRAVLSVGVFPVPASVRQTVPFLSSRLGSGASLLSSPFVLPF